MKSRIITAAVLIPIALYAFVGPLWLLGVLAFACAVQLTIEVFALTTLTDWTERAMSLVSAICLTGASIFFLFPAYLMGLVTTGYGVSRTLPRWLWAAAMLLWIDVSLVALVTFRSEIAQRGLNSWLILMPIVPLWVGDSLAYFVGRAIGKHPLAPTISPKKTWEGAIANFVGCVAAALVLGSVLHLDLLSAALCGAISGTLGQAGDLLQSAVKRKANVKDSGSLLPGHGGLFDRLDSLLATALPVLMIVATAGLERQR